MENKHSHAINLAFRISIEALDLECEKLGEQRKYAIWTELVKTKYALINAHKEMYPDEYDK